MSGFTQNAKWIGVGEGLVCYGLSDWCAPKHVANRNLMPNRFSDSCYGYAMNARHGCDRVDENAQRIHCRSRCAKWHRGNAGAFWREPTRYHGQACDSYVIAFETYF